MFQLLQSFRPLRVLITATSLITLSACGLIYKQTIAQGNLLDQKSVDELSPGMSKRQVALILGTPAIQTPFQQDRWDYLYSYKADGQPVQTKNLSLRFEDSQLTVIEGDFKPGGKAVVFKPEDALIEATREYQRELKAAKKEREIAEEEVTTE
jgi:outer membrane protein assembly factor BamE